MVITNNLRLVVKTLKGKGSLFFTSPADITGSKNVKVKDLFLSLHARSHRTAAFLRAKKSRRPSIPVLVTKKLQKSGAALFNTETNTIQITLRWWYHFVTTVLRHSLAFSRTFSHQPVRQLINTQPLEAKHGNNRLLRNHVVNTYAWFPHGKQITSLLQRVPMLTSGLHVPCSARKATLNLPW